MKCIEAKPGGYIPIGRQGENAALLVRFPTADLVGEFGTGGVYSVTHRRNTDMNAYPVATSQDADYVYWQITATDTAVDGIGDCQLTYLVSGTVARTVKYKTFVGESLDPGEAPESLDTWIDRMQVILGEYATSAYESKTDAAASKAAAAGSASDAEAYAKGTRAGSAVPSTDPAYHNNAKYYAEQSDGSAEAAAGSATNAAGSATAAAGSATNAAGSATAAEASKNAAAQSETNAAGSATAAAGSATNAAGSATAAEASKNAAATSEINAAASAAEAERVKQSIPSDYSALSAKVAALEALPLLFIGAGNKIYVHTEDQ